MSEKEKEKPLLMNELTIGQKVALGQVTNMPGFQVIVALIEAGCNRAVASTINLSPEDLNYRQALEARHQYSHAVNHFTRLVRDSINWHVKNGIIEELAVQAEAEQAVAEQNN